MMETLPKEIIAELALVPKIAGDDDTFSTISTSDSSDTFSDETEKRMRFDSRRSNDSSSHDGGKQVRFDYRFFVPNELYERGKRLLDSMEWARESGGFSGSFDGMCNYLLSQSGLKSCKLRSIPDLLGSRAKCVYAKASKILGNNLSMTPAVRAEYAANKAASLITSETTVKILCELGQNVQFLDIGTGTGFLPKKFVEIRGAHSVGVDVADSFGMKNQVATTEGKFDGVLLYDPEKQESLKNALARSPESNGSWGYRYKESTDRDKLTVDGAKTIEQTKKVANLVAFRHVLHHIPPEKRNEVLSDVRETMADNGFLWVVEHDARNELEKAVILLEHIIYVDVMKIGEMSLGWFESRNDWIEKIEGAGFEFIRHLSTEPNDTLQRTWTGVFQKK